MSLLPAFGNAISGLNDFETQLSVVGDNIANVNTNGFKANQISFQDAIVELIRGGTIPGTSAGGTNPLEVGLGANIASITQNETQGQISLTGTPTNMAVNGNGFFVLQTPNGQMYTRNGNFTLDANNNLVDANGDFVQWFAANSSGVINTTALSNANIPLGNLSIARQTANATYGGNLNAGTATGGTVTTTFTEYSSVGNPYTFQIVFTNQGLDGVTNEEKWTYATTVLTAPGPTITSGANGQIEFTSGGAVDTANSTNSTGGIGGATGGKPVLALNYSGSGLQGSNAQTITLNFLAMTQLQGQTSASVTNQDGVAMGTLNNFSTGQNGIVTGTFTNGLQQTLGQIALAGFSNPQGLARVGNTLFQQSGDSGIAQIHAPQSNGLGAVIGGGLEGSNVDLSKEFTNLIVAQRAFEANARTITTSDTILGDIIQAFGGV